MGKVDTRRDRRIAVELAVMDVRQYLRDRVARAGGSATVSLDQLAANVAGRRADLETAMVVLQHRARGMAGASIEREAGEPIRWRVTDD